jgi:hypothetical protein
MLHTLILVEKIALVGGLLHSMVPGAAPAVGTILIDHGLIEAVGPSVVVPTDAKVVNLAGKHVLPGLVDGMVNFDPDHDLLYLSCGVTLVREIGADQLQMISERDSLARDRNPGPSLFIAGAILDGASPATRTAVVMTSAAEAMDKASRMLHPESGEGIDYFSFYPGLPKDAWKAVIDLAHKKESPPRRVWGTLPAGATLEDALAAGQDGIFHLDSLLPPGKTWSDVTLEELETVAKRVGESRLAVTPTLALHASRLLPPPEKAPELKYFGPIQVAQWLADDAKRREYFTSKPERVPAGLEELKKRAALVKSLHAHKVALVPGSACGMAPWLNPGEALLDELSLWTGQLVGIDKAEALELATRGCAERIGALRANGTIEKDKPANLVVTAADPAQDLHTLHAPEWVVVRGRLLTAAELEQRRAQLAQRQQELQARAFKPLQLEAPVQPPGEPLLSGMVETRYRGQRISGERFAVSRMSDGALVFAGRALIFGTATIADTECVVQQKILGGRLVELKLTVTTLPRVIALEGTLAGGTLNVERRVNGVFQDTVRIRESAAFLECGSVVSDLILGQCVKPGEFGALYLEDFEFVSSQKWALAVDPSKGEHYLRGPTGDRIVNFEADGAPSSSVRESGRSAIERKLLEHKAEKSGLPLPPKQNPTPQKSPK